MPLLKSVEVPIPASVFFPASIPSQSCAGTVVPPGICTLFPLLFVYHS